MGLGASWQQRAEQLARSSEDALMLRVRVLEALPRLVLACPKPYVHVAIAHRNHIPAGGLLQPARPEEATPDGGPIHLRILDGPHPWALQFGRTTADFETSTSIAQCAALPLAILQAALVIL